MRCIISDLARRDELGHNRFLNPENIEFPVTLTMKIIAVDEPDLEARLIAFLAKDGVESPVVEGNHSAKGTYVTYNVEATFDTLERLRETYHRVADIEGVKMVI